MTSSIYQQNSGLRSWVGRQTSGGGKPLGQATVWPSAIDWAALSTIDSPRTGDRATVLSLGVGNAFGVAQYSGTQWELDEGVFNS